jgi:hypothetical protein
MVRKFSLAKQYFLLSLGKVVAGIQSYQQDWVGQHLKPLVGIGEYEYAKWGMFVEGAAEATQQLFFDNGFQMIVTSEPSRARIDVESNDQEKKETFFLDLGNTGDRTRYFIEDQLLEMSDNENDQKREIRKNRRAEMLAKTLLDRSLQESASEFDIDFRSRFYSDGIVKYRVVAASWTRYESANDWSFGASGETIEATTLKELIEDNFFGEVANREREVIISAYDENGRAVAVFNASWGDLMGFGWTQCRDHGAIRDALSIVI